MIELVAAFLPFALSMLLLARLVTRGAPKGGDQPLTEPQPAALPPASALPQPAALPPPAAADEHAVIEPEAPAWTTLDDLQLERLLRESSS